MCTVIDATSTAATSASMPSQSAWLFAWASRSPAPTLSRTETTIPQCTAGRSAWRPVFFRYAKLIATIRNASRPSLRVMTNA